MSCDADRQSTSLDIMGKTIGTHVGWDDGDFMQLFYYSYTPNELGLKFLNLDKAPKGDWNLALDFSSGTACLLSNDDPEEKQSGSDIVIPNPDWSVFCISNEELEAKRAAERALMEKL